MASSNKLLNKLSLSNTDVAWVQGVHPTGLITFEFGATGAGNAYIKLKVKPDESIEIGMIKSGLYKGIKYNLQKLLKIVEDKIMYLEKKKMVLENDVLFPAEEGGEPNIRGIILRALEGKPSIYKSYSFKLTNKSYTTNKNNISDEQLRYTSTMSIGLFKGLLDDLITILSDPTNIATTRVVDTMLEDLIKLSRIIKSINKDATLYNAYTNLNPANKQFLIQQLFKIISTSLKYKGNDTKLLVIYSENKEKFANYDVKLNFITALYNIYYNQQYQKKIITYPHRNAGRNNRTSNINRSTAKTSSRK
jgi:hypothetical protein